jgi:hypothetical protein
MTDALPPLLTYATAGPIPAASGGSMLKQPQMSTPTLAANHETVSCAGCVKSGQAAIVSEDSSLTDATQAARFIAYMGNAPAEWVNGWENQAEELHTRSRRLQYWL